MLNRNCTGFIFKFNFKSFFVSPHTVNYSFNRNEIILLITLPKWNPAVCTKSNTSPIRCSVYYIYIVEFIFRQNKVFVSVCWISANEVVILHRYVFIIQPKSHLEGTVVRNECNIILRLGSSVIRVMSEVWKQLPGFDSDSPKWCYSVLRTNHTVNQSVMFKKPLWSDPWIIITRWK